MSIFLIDKIKPINGQFPVYDDTDGYGGFQVRADASDRDSIPAPNRKPGMLVYTVADGKFWQLANGIGNNNWVQAAFGSSGGGGGGTTLPTGGTNEVLVTNASGSSLFAKIEDGYISNSAAINGTKIVPEFGSQNIISDGYVSVSDGYLGGSLYLNQTNNVPNISHGNGFGIIYFDDSSKKLKASEDGYNWVNLVGKQLVSIAEFNFLSGVASTSEKVYQNIGTMDFDLSKIATGFRSIKLKVVLSTSSASINCKIILYNHLQGTKVILKQPSQDYLETASTSIAVIESDDISQYMQVPSIYDVRMVADTANPIAPGDQVTCHMCKLVVDWN